MSTNYSPTADPVALRATLEGGPRRGTYPVKSLRDELWLRHLCGTRNIRLGEALYTYSRTVDKKVIFRFRRCRDLQSE